MEALLSTNHAQIHQAILDYEETYDRTVGGWRVNGEVLFCSVELEVGRLWHALTLLLQPHTVLETGTFKGYSTACIASALVSLGGPRQIVTIDPHPQDGQIWSGTELESVVTQRRQFSQDTYPELLRSRMRFDMLVLDSDHSYETIMTELMLYEPLLKAGGTILLHDSLYFDGVGAAVRQLLANPRFQGLTLDSPRQAVPGERCPGVTIVRKERDGGPELKLDARYLGWNVGDRREPPYLRS